MAKKRTTAQRRAAAKLAWKARRLKSANKPSGITVEQIERMPGFAATFAIGALGYDTLATELNAAFRQSSEGKGKERHANGRPFDRQPIMEMGRLFGPGFAAGQATKKMQEALGMLARGENDRALAEVHGAIVYAAALASLLRETPVTKPAAKRR